MSAPQSPGSDLPDSGRRLLRHHQRLVWLTSLEFFIVFAVVDLGVDLGIIRLPNLGYRWIVLVLLTLPVAWGVARLLYLLEARQLRAEERARVVQQELEMRGRVEQELNRLNEELEQRVEERTAQAAAAIKDLRAEVRERQRAEEALERLALHDALTGLPNRVLLSDRLTQQVLTAQREGRRLAVFAIDLDRFKEVNDTYGHHVGDLVLQEVAQRLRGTLRASDTVARFGGDEFVGLLPGADASSAVVAARKLVRAMASPFEIEDHLIEVGISIGMALFPEHAAEVEALVRRADAAMYEAKRSGGGFLMYRQEAVPTGPNGLTAAESSPTPRP